MRWTRCVPTNGPVVAKPLAEQIADAADRPGPDLAAPALLIARIEYPRLDPGPYLDRLDQMGEAAAHRLAADPGHDSPLAVRIDAINRYLFGEVGFAGNREHFDDPRNSCLNEVLDRKTGIPITMALVYIEVSRRAGVRAEGVNFPGHFLVRCLQDLHTDDPSEGLIVDPFHSGAILNEAECRKLLEPHMSDAAFEPSLLARATRRQILVRMLLNLKKLYVKMHSFPQARATTDALLALQPSSLADLRDRGLLAYHMNDFSRALRDLEEYLKIARMSDQQDEDQKKETEQVWEHVKTLRRRVAQ